MDVQEAITNAFVATKKRVSEGDINPYSVWDTCKPQYVLDAFIKTFTNLTSPVIIDTLESLNSKELRELSILLSNIMLHGCLLTERIDRLIPVYGIGIMHKENDFGMIHGPFRSQEPLLAIDPNIGVDSLLLSNKELYIIEFKGVGEDPETKLLYRWDFKKEVWVFLQ